VNDYLIHDLEVTTVTSPFKNSEGVFLISIS